MKVFIIIIILLLLLLLLLLLVLLLLLLLLLVLLLLLLLSTYDCSEQTWHARLTVLLQIYRSQLSTSLKVIDKLTLQRKMSPLSILGLMSVLVICGFCHEDFKVLGRHSWRCKARAQHGRATVEDNQQPTEIIPDNDLVVSSTITCCCGKKCKGYRGL